MDYCLLTGATGLLGRYLLRDLLAAQVPVAVLVRGGQGAGKRQLPEDRVEAILTSFERRTNRALPRPVVLSGELREPGLGLSEAHARWISDHCRSVLHCAASMTFRPDRQGEPWRTNVDGAGNLLDFCRRMGIGRFHHVSTAYVCGVREGRVFEDELDVGQTLGNVYEESKLAAEKLLREAGLESLTVYRPSSIVGDSQDGFTSSYHGFYLPLQLAHAFSGQVPPGKIQERFLAVLGLDGHEGKNFVPVDWAAATIAHLVTHPDLHNQTYHIASPEPVTVRLFQQVVQDAIGRFSSKPVAREISEEDLAVFERLFHDQMLIYRSHWRDDPIFDLTNAGRALQHLPCPKMDYDLLMRVARYPVERNFASPKQEAAEKPVAAQPSSAPAARRSRSSVPLAIIGMACRLPGADDLEQFWQLVREGQSAIREMPPDRLDEDLYYDPRKGIRGKTYSKLAAILSSREFHHERCPVPEEIVRSADLCHLIMCEVAAEAFRHAGLDPFRLPLRNTGVFIGHAQGSELAGEYTYGACIEEAAQFLFDSEEFRCLPDEEQRALAAGLVAAVQGKLPPRTADAAEVAASGIAGTISRAFGLSGPYLAINSACASSLQAMLLGARALQLGRIDMAIVGGASDCKADSLVLFSQAQTLSPTGSRPFDADADGLVIGEGYVCLVMKTLDRALADGDRVLAVVRGLGVSSDGRGKSLWAPRQEGQTRAMQRAYRDGLEMGQLQYIEAHATATQLGDATELNTLAKVLRDVLPPGRKVPITSVKANIGHTLESAGVAGVIKAVLALQHRIIPPAINVRNLNPKIDWQQVPIYVPTAAAPWPDPPAGQPRRAGVNAFGIGGLNMHVVLDEWTEAARGLAASAPRVGKSASDDDAVAVVGMGCVWPGAANLEKYWELLAAGRDPKCHAPADRWRIDMGPRSASGRPSRSPTTLGGFITDFHYDWRAHKLPPKQVAQADPLQFMLLEAADEALRDAGYDPRKLDREGVGVVVGTEFGNDFSCQLQMALRLPDMQRILAELLARRGLDDDRIHRVAEQFAAALLDRWPALVDESGSFSTSSLASRISKTWDLMGGAAAIDAGGASSLAALAVAVDMLLCGDCDLLVCAAGQRRMGQPAYETLAMAGLLSASPQPRAPFDAGADGYVPGEGVGVVLLKRLPDALRDGDKIRAVIRGLGAARGDHWTDALRQAARRGLDDASTRPDEIALWETDGCAEPIADRQEIETLLALHNGATRREPLLVSSVIGQIGHAGGAAGMASLVKAALEVQCREVPRTVGLETPLPIFADARGMCQPAIDTSPIAASSDRHRPVAAVSSRGKDLAYHVVLEGVDAAPAGTAAPRAAEPATGVPAAGGAGAGQIVRVGAASLEGLLAKLAAASAETLRAPAAQPRFGPADRVRAAIVADSPATLAAKLATARRMLADPAAWPALAQQGIFCCRLGSRRPRIAFLFPGQGSQYAGMLRELVGQVPAAAAALRQCDEVMARHGWPTLAQIAWEDNPDFGCDVFLTQASMLIADTVMLAAIGEFGIRPALVAGHSYGEYPALLAAGAWDFDEAIGATRVRCDAIAACPTARGTMLAANAAIEVVEEAIAASGNGVYLANHNAPDQVVLAGPRELLERVSVALAQRSCQSRMLAVPSVFHTPLMRGAAESFARALEAFSFQPFRVPLFSSVTNRYLAGPEEVPAALTEQLVTPVRYVDLVQQIAAEQATVLVEVGPQQTLTRLNRRILASADAGSIACDEPKRPGVERLYCVQAMLECCGALDAEQPATTLRATAKAAPALRREIPHFDATARRREKMRRSAERETDQARRANDEAQMTNDEAAPLLAPAPVATAVAAPEGGDLEKFLVNFVVEQTGYPPEVVELDADLEADLGIDSIKKAQLFGELREYFDVTASEDLTLDDFSTLRHVLTFLQGAPQKGRSPVGGPPAAKDAPPIAAPLPTAPPSEPVGTETPAVAGPPPVFCLAGNPREMGIEHGRQAKEAIRAILDSYAEVEGIAPGEMMSAGQATEDPRCQFSPEEIEELEGLAEAVGAPLSGLLAHNLAVSADLGGECLQFAAMGSGDGLLHGWHGQVTLSGALAACLLPAVQVRRPPDGMPYALFSLVGALGGIGGLNAAGVAITCSGTGAARPGINGRVHAALASDVLREAGDLEAAVAVLRRWQGRGVWHVCLSHAAAGRACCVRCDGASLEVRESSHGLLVETTPEGSCPETRAELQAAARGPISPAAFREVFSRLDAAGNGQASHGHAGHLTLVLDALRREVWIRQPGGRDAEEFVCVPLGPWLRGEGDSGPADADPVTGARRVPEPGEVILQRELHTQRFVMRMLDASFPPPPAPWTWHGPALVLGQNPAAEALRRRLTEEGVRVLGLEISGDVDAVLGRFERLWREGPIPHLFLASGRDAIGADLNDPAAWAEHRRRDMVLPFFLCQRWLQLAGDAQMADRCTLVTLTALGGDFGFFGPVSAPLGGSLAGLTKAIWMEYVVMAKLRSMVVKVIDAPDDEPPERLAANTLSELAGRTMDFEVAFVGGQRRLQNAVYEAPDAQPWSTEGDSPIFVPTPTTALRRCPVLARKSGQSPIRRGAVWVVTGGARGITAVSARELGRRFGLRLHLLGLSPPPEIDPSWRTLSADGLKSLKATIMLQAHQSGQSAPLAWQRVEKALEIDRWLEAMTADGTRATYHSCDVSDPEALARVLDEIRRSDGPIEGILHGAGIDRANRFEKKKREDVLATLGAKVDGAYHLMRLTRNDPVAWFIGYASISGRLGSAGQTDYSQASDGLSKLIGWYRGWRPDCRAVGFHWHHWDDHGMAAKPEVQAAMARVGASASMPCAEGVRHLLRELYAGGPRSEVLITDWDYHQRFYGIGAEEKHGGEAPRSGASCEPPEPAEPGIARRFVLRAFSAPLPPQSAAAPPIGGEVCILGDNPEAKALQERLAAQGVRVRRIAPRPELQATIVELEQLWNEAPAPTLIVMTACDAPTAGHIADLTLPYLVVQRWYQLLLAMPGQPRGTLVAATHMGGDLGCAEAVTAPQGGLFTGLLKSLYIETSRRSKGQLRLKVVDTPAATDGNAVAEAVCRELASSDLEIEVGWRGAERVVIRPVAQPVEELPRRDIERGGTWIATGGARGITAEVALDLGRRYGLVLHLLGIAPAPRADAPWRRCGPEDLKEFKAQVVREAIAEGRLPDEAWHRYRREMEIDANLRRFAAAGVKAVYHACDVADRLALARALDEIRAADGPIRGILHGAGYVVPDRFEFKKRDKVARTIRGKVEGAMNLMDLTRPDPLQYFVAFGSLGGRFGSNGMSDYSAANDMLAKLVGWYRDQRPDCAAACFHWQTWAGVGMSTLSDDLTLVRNEMKMAFISPEEGCRHLREELRAGLPASEILISDGWFQRTFYPKELCELPGTAAADGPAAPTAASRPLIDALKPGPDGQAIARIVLDPVADVFLQGHRMKGKPFLPGAAMVEALCEAAAALALQRAVVALRDLEIDSGLMFHDDRSVMAKVVVQWDDDSIACTLASELRNRQGRVVQDQRLHARGVVELSDARAELRAPPPGEPPLGWMPYHYADDGLMYHGPELRCLKAFAYQYDGGWGKIIAPAAAELAGQRPAEGWIWPMAALDACVVACGGFAFMQFGGAVEVPHRFDRLRLGRPPRAGEPCVLRFYFRGRDARHSRFDFTLHGQGNDVLLAAEGFQTVLVAQGQALRLSVPFIDGGSHD